VVGRNRPCSSSAPTKARLGVLLALRATVALRESTSAWEDARAMGTEGQVAESLASGGAPSAPSGVGIWGQIGQQAGTCVREGQMADHGTADG